MIIDFLEFLGLDGKTKQAASKRSQTTNSEESEIVECEVQEYKSEEEETIIKENDKTVKITKKIEISPLGNKKARKHIQICRQEVRNA